MVKMLKYVAPPLHANNGLSYGRRVSAILNIDPKMMAKTLVIEAGKPVMLVLPVEEEVNLKEVARLFGVKRATLATPETVLKTTGYKPGGVSPLLKGHAPLPTIIDISIENLSEVVVSAGKPGLAMSLPPKELAEKTGGTFQAVARCHF